jgi:Protein of unknown function (DUF3017)
MSSALRPSFGGVLYSAVIVAVAIGLALVASGTWRTGVGVCGGALIAAGLGRAAIPERMSGLLRVRRRPADVILTLALGVALVVLAAIVPDQP